MTSAHFGHSVQSSLWLLSTIHGISSSLNATLNLGCNSHEISFTVNFLKNAANNSHKTVKTILLLKYSQTTDQHSNIQQNISIQLLEVSFLSNFSSIKRIN